MEVAAVPWADATTPVFDITRWRAALPGAVSCKSPDYPKHGAFGVADIARLPPTLRSLDVSYCLQMTPDVSFAHLPALEWPACHPRCASCA